LTIQKNLTFLNTGTNQTPGVIVMKLDANGGNFWHLQTHRGLHVFNATNAATDRDALTGFGSEMGWQSEGGHCKIRVGNQID
jgi:hypothetical protein